MRTLIGDRNILTAVGWIVVTFCKDICEDFGGPLTFCRGPSYVHVDAGVDGRLVHHHVKLRQDVVQGAVVSEAAPLCVDAHPPVLALHALHVLHLLHVAGVGSRTYRGGKNKKKAYFIIPFGILYVFNLLSGQESATFMIKKSVRSHSLFFLIWHP